MDACSAWPTVAVVMSWVECFVSFKAPTCSTAVSNIYISVLGGDVASFRRVYFAVWVLCGNVRLQSSNLRSRVVFGGRIK